MNKNKEGTVVTGAETRLDYVTLETPVGYKGDQNLKYSVCLIIPKTDTKTLQAIEAAIEAVLKKGKEKTWKPLAVYGEVTDVKIPVRDGDKERRTDDYKGCYFVFARTKEPPKIWNKKGDRISPSEFYDGVFARAVIKFFPYLHEDIAGIACQLKEVMKVKDGETISHEKRRTAKRESDFDFDSEDESVLKKQNLFIDFSALDAVARGNF